MKIEVKYMIAVMVCAISLVSCSPNPSNIIQDVGGGGNFIVVNTNSNDTLIVYGGLYVDIRETLVAHNGNIIKIRFEQNEKYKDYSFTIKYTLPNDEIVENQSEYEYVIKDDIPEGLYSFNMTARSEGETKKDKWQISTGGGFILNVIK